jgi:CRISPR-associated endonuclease/helicase Cas3
MKYSKFFHVATDGRKPYPYQEQFATADELPHLLRAPTGAGKTAAAVLGWLYRRHANPVSTPRRLIYCLPMRVLVEQSCREAGEWIANLKKHHDAPLIDKALAVQMLMGGVEAEEEPWYLHPERPAILIGTQDMLLSRALNRGYAASRFHWPIDFGLLNNDCLWIFDEPQLMAGGVATSAQLAGLRKKLTTFNSCPSVWMSATLEPTWLDTIDFIGEFPAQPLELDKADYDTDLPLKKRMTAKKTLSATDVASSKDMKGAAKRIWTSHESGTQTLVVINTVDRAKAVYLELEKLRKKADSPALLLIHSRFRPYERVRLNETLQNKEPGDRIIVATQVIEAGVDISARTLVTELAPWPSLVQRMGRCNRTGDDSPGQVLWLDLDEKSYPPYDERDLLEARGYLEKLEGEDVSPKALDKFKDKEGFTLRFEHRHVMRRRDLMDLFDTAPDLSGNDIDVARFIRSDDPDTDAQVFWRVLSGDTPSADEPQPSREELCAVPVKALREFLESAGKKRDYGFVWNHLDCLWEKLDPKLVRPGIVVLLPGDVGGYDWDDDMQSGRGWDPNSTKSVKSRKRPENASPPPDVASDENTQNGAKLTISAHTENVFRELAMILGDRKLGLRLPNDWAMHLTRAARWHDAGKAHDVFRIAMEKLNGPAPDGQHWAKSGSRGRLNYERKYFRHELASALAALQHDLPFAVAYLVASHHGRPRLTIRALPDETEPPTPDTLFALGVHQGDTFGPADLGGETCPAVVIDLSPMQLGGDASWTARALKLLEELGPFKLAYLEALLRAADMRASRKEAKPDA